MTRKSGKSSAGGFGQTVGLQNINAKCMEVVSDQWIETRAAGDQIAHLVAESAVQLAKENSACVESEHPQTTVERHQGFEHPTRERAAPRHLLKYALMDQIEKL